MLPRRCALWTFYLFWIRKIKLYLGIYCFILGLFILRQKSINSRRYAQIHVARQIIRTSSPHVHFSEKYKKSFLNMAKRSLCTKFKVSIIFRLVSRWGTNPPRRWSKLSALLCKHTKLTHLRREKTVTQKTTTTLKTMYR